MDETDVTAEDFFWRVYRTIEEWLEYHTDQEWISTEYANWSDTEDNNARALANWAAYWQVDLCTTCTWFVDSGMDCHCYEHNEYNPDEEPMEPNHVTPTVELIKEHVDIDEQVSMIGSENMIDHYELSPQDQESMDLISRVLFSLKQAIDNRDQYDLLLAIQQAAGLEHYNGDLLDDHLDQDYRDLMDSVRDNGLFNTFGKSLDDFLGEMTA